MSRKYISRYISNMYGLYKCLFIMLILIFYYFGNTYATVINVTESQLTIQDAINRSQDGDTIIVQSGIYKGKGNNSIDFLGKKITLKCGSPDRDCVIDCQEEERAFTFQNNETQDSVISGFTIKNCHSHDSYEGGVVLCKSSSPTISNISFYNNSSDGVLKYIGPSNGIIDNCSFINNSFSAIYIQGAYPTITNCIFDNNTGSDGGAIKASYAYGFSIERCLFKNNRAEKGGAIYSLSSSYILKDSSVIENKADIPGLALRGGGLFLSDSSASINNCDISNNYSKEVGGGIDLSYYSSVTIINSRIDSNKSEDYGGGIFTLGRYANDSMLINSILSNNWSHSGGAIHHNQSSTFYIYNTTIVDNVAAKGGGISGYGCEIKNSILWDNSSKEITDESIIVINSNIKGGWPGDGNIDLDPLFIDSNGGNYRLTSDSPCINAGTNNDITLMDKDKHGNPRIYDGTIDMGAYEHIRTNPPTIAQSPTSGGPGTTFTQWGTGFTPNSMAILHFKKPDGVEYPIQKQSINNTGGFQILYIVPSDKHEGAYTWWAIDGATGMKSNEVSYTITDAPKIDQSPMSGPPGTTFTQWGTGFIPNSTAILYFPKYDGVNDGTKEMPIDAQGRFSEEYKSGTNKPAGTYTWWAVDGVTGAKSNKVTYTIDDSDRSEVLINIFYKKPGESHFRHDEDATLKWPDGEAGKNQVIYYTGADAHGRYTSYYPLERAGNHQGMRQDVYFVQRLKYKNTLEDVSVSIVWPQAMMKESDLTVNSNPTIFIHGLNGEANYWYDGEKNRFWEGSLPSVAGQSGAIGDVWSIFYPKDESGRKNAYLIGLALQKIASKYPGKKINIVTHSFGGLVFRALIQDMASNGNSVIPLNSFGLSTSSFNRIVFIAPPFHGSAGAWHATDHGNRIAQDAAWTYAYMVGGDMYSPAYEDLSLGSKFIWDLNSRVFPIDSSRVLVLAGVNDFEIPLDDTRYCDDGMVSLSSANMNDGITNNYDLMEISLDHGEIVGIGPENACIEGQCFTGVDVTDVSMITQNFIASGVKTCNRAVCTDCDDSGYGSVGILSTKKWNALPNFHGKDYTLANNYFQFPYYNYLTYTPEINVPSGTYEFKEYNSLVDRLLGRLPVVTKIVVNAASYRMVEPTSAIASQMKSLESRKEQIRVFHGDLINDLVFIVYSRNDSLAATISVANPAGLIVSKSTNGIGEDAAYAEEDENSDGYTDSLAAMTNAPDGTYTISLENLSQNGLDEIRLIAFLEGQEIVIQDWTPVESLPQATFTFDTDLTAPAAVSDLTAVQGTDPGTVGLRWTATGDDDVAGKAKEYELRYSTEPLTETNWSASEKLMGIPVPVAAGLSQTADVTMPENNVVYYFAIRVRDESGNTSAISDVASAESGPGEELTGDITAPQIPEVTDEGDSVSKTSGLVFRWSASDNESGISGYTYAIGTVPYSEDIIERTFTKSQEVTVGETYFRPGQTYYCTVRAINGEGLVSDPGVSDGILIEGIPTHTLSVIIRGNGKVESGTGIGCPSDCTEALSQGSEITLAATPDPDWKFDHWLVDNVSDPQESVSVVMDSDKFIVAVFIQTTDITLNPGWNLTSVPLSPSETAIGNVLSPVATFCDMVWSYQGGQWLMYDPAHPALSNLSTLDAGYGYWIRMKEETSLILKGTPAPKTIFLKAGWNLVGYNRSESLPAETALEKIKDQVEGVWSYQNGKWLMYDPKDAMFSDLQELSPGYGYWIKVKSDCQWDLP